MKSAEQQIYPPMKKKIWRRCSIQTQGKSRKKTAVRRKGTRGSPLSLRGSLEDPSPPLPPRGCPGDPSPPLSLRGSPEDPSLPLSVSLRGSLGNPSPPLTLRHSLEDPSLLLSVSLRGSPGDPPLSLSGSLEVPCPPLSPSPESNKRLKFIILFTSGLCC